MPTIATLATDRLILRPPAPGDLEDIVALNADPDVMAFIGNGETQSRAQSAHWLETLMATARYGHPSPGAPEWIPGWFVTIEQESGAFAGLMALTMLPRLHIEAIGEDLCPAPCVELGFRYAKPFWGRGYATEAGARLVRYAFDNGLNQLVAIADVRNHASNRALEKLGLAHRKTYELNGITINFRSMDLRPSAQTT